MRKRMQTMSRARSAQRHSKFLRVIRTPYIALCRVRDMYVRSVTQCGQPAPFAPSKQKSKSNLPRSFSAASSSSILTLDNNEDYRELVRAASVRTLSDNGVVDGDTAILPRGMQLPRSVPRSASVGIGMGRIDEDAPFEVEGSDEIGQSGFGGGIRNKKRGDLLYPRSKSHAVVNYRNVVAF